MRVLSITSQTRLVGKNPAFPKYRIIQLFLKERNCDWNACCCKTIVNYIESLTQTFKNT